MSVSLRVGAAHLQQLQTQVADLGEQAVQGRLVDDGAGDGGLASFVAGHPHAVEPGRPAAVQDAPDADLVVHLVAPSCAAPPQASSAGEQGDDGQQDPNTRGPQGPGGMAAGLSSPAVGLLERLLLVLHVVVVVQQVSLAGAVAAVAGIELPRLVLVLGQHGRPSSAWEPTLPKASCSISISVGVGVGL